MGGDGGAGAAGSGGGSAEADAPVMADAGVWAIDFTEYDLGIAI